MKVKQGNPIILKRADKTDNTVTEGYITSEQLIEEMKKSANATISYIEAQKNNMTEEDRIALKEQINDANFRAQLKSAVMENKDKIDSIYHKNRISANIKRSYEELDNKRKAYYEAYDKFEKEALKYENERLKKNQKTE